MRLLNDLVESGVYRSVHPRLTSCVKMVCLFCQCLNVSVHCKETSWKTRAVSASQLFPDGSKERLVTGRESVYEVDLDVAGVFTVSVSSEVFIL